VPWVVPDLGETTQPIFSHALEVWLRAAIVARKAMYFERLERGRVSFFEQQQGFIGVFG
jgi:hypothetical protein